MNVHNCINFKYKRYTYHRRSATQYEACTATGIMEKNREPVRWEEPSWEQITKIRDDALDMVILPMGATKQHGLQLPTGVDTAARWGIQKMICTLPLPTETF